MAAVEYLKPFMPVSHISRAMDMPRSSCCRRTGLWEKRKPWISTANGDGIIRIAGERTT